MLWQDLQEIFVLTVGPFVVYLLLPVFISAGVILAGLMTIARLWRFKSQQGGGSNGR